MTEKTKRMGELGSYLIKLTTTEPRLTSEDIAIVLTEELEDVTEFLKFYKKHNKQNKLI